MMPNVKMILEYDGEGFHGWQRQKGVRTVQGELEEKLAVVLREPVALTGAGRTDAGCHASRQVASFRTEAGVPLSRIAHALNGLMRGEVVVVGIEEASESFNARFSAISRTYRYRIAQRPTSLLRRTVWVLDKRLHTSDMARGAESLLGRHDFSGFSKADERVERNPFSVVRRASWLPWELGVELEIEADRFTRGMVRMIVGTMVRIGTGKIPPHCVNEILEGRPGPRAGPCAPAKGLCLMDVKYG